MIKDITKGSGFQELTPTFAGTEEYNVKKDMAKFESGNTKAIVTGLTNTIGENFSIGWGLTAEKLNEVTNDGDEDTRLGKTDNYFQRKLVEYEDKKKYDSYNNSISYGIGGFAGDFFGDFTNPTGLAREGVELLTDKIGFVTLGIPGIVAAQVINASWSSMWTKKEEMYRARALGYINDTSWSTYLKGELLVRAAIVGSVSLGINHFRKKEALKKGIKLKETPEAVADDILNNKDTYGFKDQRTKKQVAVDEENLSKQTAKNKVETNELLKQYKKGKLSREVLDKQLSILEDSRTELEKTRLKFVIELSTNLNAIRAKEAESIAAGNFGEISFVLDKTKFSESTKKIIDEVGETNLIQSVIDRILFEDPATALRAELDYFDLDLGEIPKTDPNIYKLTKDEIKEILVSSKEITVKSQETPTKVKTDAELAEEAKAELGKADAEKTADDAKKSQSKSVKTTKEGKRKGFLGKIKDKLTKKKQEEIKQAEVKKPELIPEEEIEVGKILDTTDEILLEEIPGIPEELEELKEEIIDEIKAIKPEETPKIKIDEITETEIVEDIIETFVIKEDKPLEIETLELSNEIKSDPSIVLKHKKRKFVKYKKRKEIDNKGNLLTEIDYKIPEKETKKNSLFGVNVTTPYKKLFDDFDFKEELIKKAKETKEVLEIERKKLYELIDKAKKEKIKVKALGDKKESKKIAEKIISLSKHLSNKDIEIKNLKTKEEILTSMVDNFKEYRKKYENISETIISQTNKLNDPNTPKEKINTIKKIIDELKKNQEEVSRFLFKTSGFEFDVSDHSNHEKLVNRIFTIDDQQVIIKDVRVQWNTKNYDDFNSKKETVGDLLSNDFNEEKQIYIEYVKTDGTTDFSYIEDIDWFERYELPNEVDQISRENIKYDKTNPDFLYDPTFYHEAEEIARAERAERMLKEGFTIEELEATEIKLKEKNWSKTGKQIELEKEAEELIDLISIDENDLDAESLLEIIEEDYQLSTTANSYNNLLHSEYIFNGSNSSKAYKDFLIKSKRAAKLSFEKIKEYGIFDDFAPSQINSFEKRKKMTKNLSKEQKKNLSKDRYRYETKKNIDNIRESLKLELILLRNKSSDPGELLKIDSLIKKISSEIRYEFINQFESKTLDLMKSKSNKEFTKYEKSLLYKTSRVKGADLKSIKSKADSYIKLIKENAGTTIKYQNIEAEKLIYLLDEKAHLELEVEMSLKFQTFKNIIEENNLIKATEDMMYDMDELSKPASGSKYVVDELKENYNFKDKWNNLEIKKKVSSLPFYDELFDIKRADKIAEWNSKYGSEMKLRILTNLVDNESSKLIEKILSETDEVAGQSLRILEQYLKREGVLTIVDDPIERKISAINDFLEHRTYYQNMTGDEADLVRKQTNKITELISNYDVKNLIKSCN